MTCAKDLPYLNDSINQLFFSSFHSPDGDMTCDIRKYLVNNHHSVPSCVPDSSLENLWEVLLEAVVYFKGNQKVGVEE